MSSYSLSKIVKPVGDGVSGAYYLEVSAIGKHSLMNRWLVASEYICARLGGYIGLPIPPCAILETRGTAAHPWFGSLSFSLTGQTLPPVDPSECVSDFLDISTGTVLFDIWIANSDRHNGNLSIDKTKTKHRFNVFDHSHALFGSEGTQRTSRLMNKFGIDELAETNGANRHCLLDVLPSDSYFESWIHRIERTPSWLIDRVCQDTVDVGLLASGDAKSARIFISHRANELRRMVEQNKHEFKSMTWSWFSPNASNIWDGPHI